jgi:SRSO17 transposase
VKERVEEILVEIEIVYQKISENFHPGKNKKTVLVERKIPIEEGKFDGAEMGIVIIQKKICK